LRYFPLVRAIRRQLVARPALFFPLARLAGNRQLLDRETGLVFDGFPRCGNSFAEGALLYSQADRGLMLKSHAHSPAQVLRAVRKGLPTLVLVRDPDAAIASLIAAFGVDKPEMHYRDYIAYYEPLIGKEKGFVVVDFPVLIQRFDLVLCAINERFGTDLAIPRIDAEFAQGAENARDAASIARTGRAPEYANLAGRDAPPDRSRQRAILDRLKSDAHGGYRDLAHALHRQFAGCGLSVQEGQ